MATVQFVDSIASSPTVRLDLNAAPWRVLAEGTDISPPELRRAEISSMLADGGRVAESSYENRVLTLHLRVQDNASTDAVLSQVQLLARELDRRAVSAGGVAGPDNILKWQPRGATNPVFFRTFRSPLGKYADVLVSRKEVVIDILAEPFAYGLKVTNSAVTVANDPVAVTNPMSWDITGVKGDVETPLDLSFPASAVIAAGRRTSAVAVRRRGTPSSAPFWLQAEAATLGSNVSLPGNDTVMVGSGSNYARCASAGLSSPFATKLTSAVFPSSASVDARGTYRRFARVRQNDGADEVRYRLDVGDGTTWIDGDEVIGPSTTARRYVDLGLAQLPVGYDPVITSAGGTPIAVRGAQWRTRVARTFTNGTGTLDLDGTAFLPADDRLCFIKWPGTSGPTTLVLDSENEAVYALGSSSELYSTEVVTLTGGPPHVSPGETNRIYFMLDVGSTSSGGDDKTLTTSITASYHPRYLQAAPLST